MAETTLNMTAMNGALKELYDDQKVNNLVYKNNPFLAMVPKDEGFGGKYKPYPVVYGSSQGRSSTFSTAQANQTAALVQEFLLTRKKDYSIATIDNETLEVSQTDQEAFLKGSELMIDGAFRTITNSLASSLFRSGTGSIGLIATAGITSGVITLNDPASVVQFEVNQTLQANATDGGGSPRAALGYVISVDRSAGTVTVASSGLGGSAASPASWAAGDYLLVQGDNNAKISGLAAWIPSSAPGATSFYGVDRSVDTTRLGGVRYNGASQSIEEALIDASSLVGREGGMTTHCFMTFASYSALEKSLGSKVQYCDLKGPGEIGFRGIRINGPNGEIKCVADRNQLGSTAHLLDMGSWQLASRRKAPHILTYGDGAEIMRVYNADSGELRVGYYANLVTNAPGWNAHVTLGA